MIKLIKKEKINQKNGILLSIFLIILAVGPVVNANIIDNQIEPADNGAITQTAIITMADNSAVENMSITTIPIVKKETLGTYEAGHKYYINIYNVDDIGKVIVNGQSIAQVDYDQESGWIDITNYLSQGNNTIEFDLENTREDWTYGFKIREDDSEIIWKDSCGNVKKDTGCMNNDQTLGLVYTDELILTILPVSIPTSTVTNVVTETPVTVTNTPIETVTPNNPTTTTNAPTETYPIKTNTNSPTETYPIETNIKTPETPVTVTNTPILPSTNEIPVNTSHNSTTGAITNVPNGTTITLPKARLEVTYEADIAKEYDRQTIKVYIKNGGNATATDINLSISHPHILDPRPTSGGDELGDIISWKGNLKPEDSHIVEYSIKSISGQEIDIPLQVTYNTISPEEKGRYFGVSSKSPTPDDQAIISLIIKVVIPQIPGFYAILAFFTIGLTRFMIKIKK